MTEYVKGARYRVTFEGTWDATEGDEGLSLSERWKFYPNYVLGVATSVEKIADPEPEWLPGDKVLRDQTDIAIYRGDDRWDVFYGSNSKPDSHLTWTVLNATCDPVEVLVKQGKRVVQ